jgi:hypothetical protein
MQGQVQGWRPADGQVAYSQSILGCISRWPLGHSQEQPGWAGALGAGTVLSWPSAHMETVAKPWALEPDHLGSKLSSTPYLLCDLEQVTQSFWASVFLLIK